MVLYSGVTQSPFGGARGAPGPFYCPADETAYFDTEFFDPLLGQLGSSGDFAAAYVIAHEVAHDVHNELGILGQVNQRRQQVSEREANALTVGWNCRLIACRAFGRGRLTGCWSGAICKRR